VVESEERPLVTVAQAAAVLGVSPKTIYSWRARRYIAPVGLPLDGPALYDLDELEREHATDRRCGGA
jgi:hypothetical protein